MVNLCKITHLSVFTHNKAAAIDGIVCAFMRHKYNPYILESYILGTTHTVLMGPEVNKRILAIYCFINSSTAQTLTAVY